MNIVVFDLETKLRPGQDCTWEQHDKMGVSVGCAFDYMTGEYSVYLDDNLCALWTRLANADLVVGFNITKFDVPVLYGAVLSDSIACGGGADEADYHLKTKAKILSRVYDIYDQSKVGAGAGTYDKGYKCDEHLRALWGAEAGKTGDGANAPILFKEGKMGDLISYCLADVHRERRLFERCWNHGSLKTMGFKAGKEDFNVRFPQECMGYSLNQGVILPHPMDGPLPTQPVPGPAYVLPTQPTNLASQDI